MQTDQLSSMYAQIVNGVAKSESKYVTNTESSRLWDKIAAGVAADKKRGWVSEMVDEIPDIDPPRMGR